MLMWRMVIKLAPTRRIGIQSRGCQDVK
jgi:hypothetical protein